VTGRRTTTPGGGIRGMPNAGAAPEALLRRTREQAQGRSPETGIALLPRPIVSSWPVGRSTGTRR